MGWFDNKDDDRDEQESTPTIVNYGGNNVFTNTAIGSGATIVNTGRDEEDDR